MAADFMIADKFCFRKFAITSNIGDPFNLGGPKRLRSVRMVRGLENNVFNLVGCSAASESPLRGSKRESL